MSQKAVTASFQSKKDVSVEVVEHSAELGFSDSNGNVVAEFSNGHIRTKNFDSRESAAVKDSEEDLTIEDDNNHILVEFSNGHIRTKNFDSRNVPYAEGEQNIPLKICVIGNSYSCDSFMYLPFMLKEYGIDIEIGVYFRPAGSLQNQIDEFSTGSYEFFYIDTTKQTAWKTISTTFNPQKSILFKKWDIIVIQQSSEASIDLGNFIPAARTLINKIMDSVDYPFKLGWNININRASSGSDYNTIGNSILSNIRDTLEREAVDIVFPYGTAIFDARTNPVLASLGDGGNLWANDKVHLQEGLPCYLACLTNMQTLFEYYYPKFSVLNDQTRPNDTLVSQWAVKNAQGNCTGISEENCRLAQLCAIIANKYKLEIKPINN